MPGGSLAFTIPFLRGKGGDFFLFFFLITGSSFSLASEWTPHLVLFAIWLSEWLGTPVTRVEQIISQESLSKLDRGFIHSTKVWTGGFFFIWGFFFGVLL